MTVVSAESTVGPGADEGGVGQTLPTEGPECQAREPGLVSWRGRAGGLAGGGGLCGGLGGHRRALTAGRPGSGLHRSLLFEPSFPDALASLARSCFHLLLRRTVCLGSHLCVLVLKTRTRKNFTWMHNEVEEETGFQGRVG